MMNAMAKVKKKCSDYIQVTCGEASVTQLCFV